jgi:hypothetical protein
MGAFGDLGRLRPRHRAMILRLSLLPDAVRFDLLSGIRRPAQRAMNALAGRSNTSRGPLPDLIILHSGGDARMVCLWPRGGSAHLQSSWRLLSLDGGKRCLQPAPPVGRRQIEQRRAFSRRDRGNVRRAHTQAELQVGWPTPRYSARRKTLRCTTSPNRRCGPLHDPSPGVKHRRPLLNEFQCAQQAIGTGIPFR